MTTQKSHKKPTNGQRVNQLMESNSKLQLEIALANKKNAEETYKNRVSTTTNTYSGKQSEWFVSFIKY